MGNCDIYFVKLMKLTKIHMSGKFFIPRAKWMELFFKPVRHFTVFYTCQNSECQRAKWKSGCQMKTCRYTQKRFLLNLVELCLKNDLSFKMSRIRVSHWKYPFFRENICLLLHLTVCNRNRCLTLLKGLRMVDRALWRSEARRVVPWSETLHEP